MGGMQHGTGMMSDADMSLLDMATGRGSARTWVQMMISQNQGAVTMASTEQATGQNPDAKKLAQSIVTSRPAQSCSICSPSPT